MPITPPDSKPPNPDPEPETRPADELVPRAGLPILSCGSQDPIVPTLFAKLAELGIETPTSRGLNPHGVVGVEEIAAVRAFRREHGVSDDAEAFGGDHDEGRKIADSHVGPWSIEAILRAHEARVA